MWGADPKSVAANYIQLAKEAWLGLRLNAAVLSVELPDKNQAACGTNSLEQLLEDAIECDHPTSQSQKGFLRVAPEVFSGFIGSRIITESRDWYYSHDKFRSCDSTALEDRNQKEAEPSPCAPQWIVCQGNLGIMVGCLATVRSSRS